MSRRVSQAMKLAPAEGCIISDYVRLCLVEGIRPRDAYIELKKRVQAAKKCKRL
jgi:hypothetical protein